MTAQDQWQAAQNLGPLFNTSASEYGPSLSADRLTLYFTSNRPGGVGGHDLYVTTRESRQGPWGKPVNLGAVVNSEFDEVNPSISRDGLALCFSDVETSTVVARPGGLGDTDVWVTTRASLSAPWGPPVNLGAPVNGGGADGSPEISDDGLLLFVNRWLLGSASGALMTELRSGGRVGATLASLAVITDGNWHRVAFVWDGGNRTLYADDAPVATDVQDGLQRAYGDLLIGAGPGLTAGALHGPALFSFNNSYKDQDGSVARSGGRTREDRQVRALAILEPEDRRY
ncbi:MAG: LamG domain-containing protein [Planctomycetes bacterium]|nr:LamG domain-containing protein [Planctomycetota bacterium]